MRPSPRHYAVPILLCALLTSGRPQDPPPIVVTVEANDFAFSLPATVPAGVVTFRLVNHGKESHHAQVVRLEGGKTAADVIKTFANPVAIPEWMRYLGGPVGTAPGREQRSTTRLTPGRYAMICRIASSDGAIHLMKGMIREFEVIAAGDDASDELPTATDTITMNDYGYASSRPLGPGRHTIRVENAGPQPHELVMLRLNPGKTPADFAKWGLAGRHGPAPAMPIGGVEFFDRGAAGVFEVDLAPGDYGYICFVPDAKDGKRHFLHGMVTQFTVR